MLSAHLAAAFADDSHTQVGFVDKNTTIAQARWHEAHSFEAQCFLRHIQHAALLQKDWIAFNATTACDSDVSSCSGER